MELVSELVELLVLFCCLEFSLKIILTNIVDAIDYKSRIISLA
jgi:hypothetical protein